jgi:PD-(D/E)XK nuclease superfamily
MNWPQLNADKGTDRPPDFTEMIIGISYPVASGLDLGFLESVYESAMALALTEKSISLVLTKQRKQISIDPWKPAAKGSS